MDLSRAIVGVALGSGGAKGFAHIGVLKALEEQGIPIDVVAGSSMGSLVGAFYATGMRPSFMEQLASTLRWRHWADFTVPKLGLMAGDRIHQMVAMLTRSLHIEQADKPLAIVATDLLSRSRVVFTTGPIADAVRASISIPGVFVPYVFNQGVYVDGGVLDRVPVEAARALGADVVIGVDVAVVQRTEAPETMMDVIVQSLDIMQAHVHVQRAAVADLTIEPDLSDVKTSQFHKAPEAIDAGYQAALSVMDDIRTCVQQSGRETS